ncbi:MAG TPA: hypothetical protein VLS90_20500, partial [Thermodesulfobacteriota bacterium]|nr:hypothetical protein [Thermodesulfobacteriota bacterium]
MNVGLKTNDETQSLHFKDIERFPDGSGYGATILVRSRGFSVATRFYFEPQPLEAFLVGLKMMDRSLKGKAMLKPLWEGHFVEFEMGTLGRVRVRGEIIEYSHMRQSLHFAFETDQTCLSPFIRDLEKWREMPAASED